MSTLALSQHSHDAFTEEINPLAEFFQRIILHFLSLYNLLPKFARFIFLSCLAIATNKHQETTVFGDENQRTTGYHKIRANG